MYPHFSLMESKSRFLISIKGSTNLICMMLVNIEYYHVLGTILYLRFTEIVLKVCLTLYQIFYIFYQIFFISKDQLVFGLLFLIFHIN